MFKSSVYKIVQLLIIVFLGASVLYLNDRNIQDKNELADTIQSLNDEVTSLKQYSLDADASLSDRLIKTEKSLGILSKDAQDIVQMQSRLAQESNTKIAELSKELAGTQQSLNTSLVVNAWRPYIVKIECEWDKGSKIYSKDGSAFLTKSTERNYPHLITSKHVLTLSENEKPDKCTAKLPDIKDPIGIPKSDIYLTNDDYDLGYLNLTQQSFEIDARANKSEITKICSNATVGDKVVILGYPSIGTKNDVTATEGIISGQDAEYYITSAKVEQGNSGGAAILVPQRGESCYLGIPTFAYAGKIEALARILSASVFR